MQERIPAIAVVGPMPVTSIRGGAVAGELFSSVRVPGRAVIFCPNHTGIGEDAASHVARAWRMPWGTSPSTRSSPPAWRPPAPSCGKTRRPFRGARDRGTASVPSRFRPDVRIVPVALGRLSLGIAARSGSVADAIAGDAERPLLVASSDMSHYVPDTVARAKDGLAIDRMLALDPEGLYATVRKERISMCGVLPATVALFAARRLGATTARLIRYATSGDVSREFDQVVGYAGLAFA